MNITVIGCGRWGSFLGWYSAKLGHHVVLCGRKESRVYETLKRTRRNEYLKLQPNVEFTDSLSDALATAQTVLIAIGAQQLRELCGSVRQCDLTGKTFVLCMKGLEAETGRRLTQVFREEIPEHVSLAVWLGPGHVQDFIIGTPNCMVLGADDIEIAHQTIEVFSSELIRFYVGQDLIGNEVGAATKNVIGIAAGMLDGLGLTALKGALMARGTREIARLVRAMGGNEITAYGLSHLGDYEATLFSPHSHNRRYGESFVCDRKFERLAEGIMTMKALLIMARKHDVELPICSSINSIVHNGEDAREVLKQLFLRPLKSEF